MNDPGPLTPSHFLLGTPASSRTELIFDNTLVSDLTLNHTVRQSCLRNFWQTWSEQYISQLPPVISKQKNVRNVIVGDLVLVHDPNVSRLKWPLAKVVKTFLGSDNIVRSVELKTQNGKLLRSVQGLHFLEASRNVNPLTNNNIQVPVIDDNIIPEDNQSIDNAIASPSGDTQDIGNREDSESGDTDIHHIDMAQPGPSSAPDLGISRYGRRRIPKKILDM